MLLAGYHDGAVRKTRDHDAMKRSRADVVVVGSGPGGTAA
jgi:alkyl hydroperoxide reductase subunit AhpF